MVIAEMNENIRRYIRVKSNVISALLTIMVYLMPFSHLLTGVGLIYWYIVAEKYVIFLLVCAGIWTKQCVDGYDLDGESLTGLEDVEYNNDNDPDYKLRGFHLFVNEACQQNEGVFYIYKYACIACVYMHVPFDIHASVVLNWLLMLLT